MPFELKDISTMSGGTFVVPAFGAAGIKQPHVIVSPVEQGLQNAVRVHNAMHTDPSQRAEMPAVRAVYRRGARAYKRGKAGTSRRQHAMKRVQNHLAHLATGKHPTGFAGDNDLLPAEHPHATSTAAECKALMVIEGRPERIPDVEPVPLDALARLAVERKWLGFDTLEVKAVWDPDKHPRDHHGRFAHIGAAVDALIGGKHESGTIVGIRGQSVRVRTADGTESTVKAADTTITGNVGDHMSLAEHAKAHSDAERHVKAMQKAGHPETAAWQARHKDLGEALKSRVAGKSGDEIGQEMRGDAPAAGQQPARDDGKPATPDTRPDGSAWGSGYSPKDPRSDPAYDKYVADVDARTAKATAEVGDTKSMFHDPETGAYTPERQALHDRILKTLADKYASVPRERRAVVLAGPSGAGKSTLIKAKGHEFGVEHDEDGHPTNFATINPDDIKDLIVSHGGLPAEYAQYGLGEGEHASLLHEESSHLANRLRDALTSRGTNVLMDGTFSGKDAEKQAKKVRDLRGLGYAAHGVLVNGDVETSLERAGKRHTQGIAPTAGGDPLPGRYVPLEHIASQRPSGQFSALLNEPHRSQSGENFEAARPAFDAGFRIYDNSGGDPKLTYSEEPGTFDETQAPLDEGRLAAVAGVSGGG